MKYTYLEQNKCGKTSNPYSIADQIKNKARLDLPTCDIIQLANFKFQNKMRLFILNLSSLYL